MASCAVADKELTDIEQVFMIKGVLNDAQVQQAAKLCTQLKADMDTGKDKANGLKAWFKL